MASPTKPEDKPLTLTPIHRVLSPPLNLHPPNTPPELFSSCLSHFTSIPWCASLLSQPLTFPFIPQCFNPLTASHDQFVGATLHTPRGLSHLLCFFRADDPAHALDPKRPILKTSALFSVGEGLCGYSGVLHGGMIMTMADEAMGVLQEINLVLGKEVDAFQASNVTAGLEIRFMRPGPVSGAVLVNAWVEGVEGRKTKIRCEIKDGEGRDIAKCSSTWVAVKPKI